MENDLVRVVKLMAQECGLENYEQICTERGAIGAVLMIQSEYLDLRSRYLKLLARGEKAEDKR